MKQGDRESLQVGILAGTVIGLLSVFSRPASATGGLLPAPEPVVITAEEIEVIPEPITGTQPEPVPVYEVRRDHDEDVCGDCLDYLQHVTPDTQDQIATEIFYGEMELVAQLIRAEAGNQPFEGKRRVAAVVYNRLEDPDFPDTIEEVIFQKHQFSVTENGAFDRAAWTVDTDDYLAALVEWEHRSDTEVLYFTAGGYGQYGTPAYQLADHFFSVK